MIGKQYKKTRDEKRKGQERVLSNVKSGISPDSRILKGQEWPNGIFQDLSSQFFCRLGPSPIFYNFGQEWKKGQQNLLEQREKKESVSFPFLSCSFFHLSFLGTCLL